MTDLKPITLPLEADQVERYERFASGVSPDITLAVILNLGAHPGARQFATEVFAKALFGGLDIISVTGGNRRGLFRSRENTHLSLRGEAQLVAEIVLDVDKTLRKHPLKG